MKKWVLILLMLLLTLPGYALITIEKKPGTGTLSGHLDDINANDLELDGKIDDKVSDDAFTDEWEEVTDVAPSQAALYNYLINFDADGDGLFSDEAWFPSIFDPAVPGDIGGTTAAAGTFTDLIAGTLTLTPVDGSNRLTFPENTTRSPASGAEEIYNEGGLMTYSENGVEKRFVTIDDTAGDGDTTVTLSADKIVELIEAGVVDDTDYGVSWDGITDEAPSKNAVYDKIFSLETQVTDMIAAFSAAGLNSFTFAPSVTYPIYTNDTTPTITVDVTDTSSTYAVDEVNYKLGSGSYAAMTNTTGDTWSVTLPTQTAGTYNLQFNATDDKSTPNTGESSVYTGSLIIDLTNPTVGTVTPDPATHDGTGTAIELTIASITEANEASRQYRVYNVTDAAVTEAYQAFTGLTINETLPADEDTYRIDVLVTDRAGNTGSASSANISYEAVGQTEYTVYITENTTDFNGVTYSGITRYAGVDDTHILEAAPTTNYGTEDHLRISTYSTGDFTNTLIRFSGLSNIPSTATVTSIEIGYRAYITRNEDSFTFGLYPCLRDWSESESTWTVYSAGNNWQTAGGTGALDSSSSVGTSTFDINGGVEQWYTITQTSGTIIDLVQDWVDGSADNNGFLLKEPTETSLYGRFYSSEYTNGLRPYIKVVYED